MGERILVLGAALVFGAVVTLAVATVAPGIALFAGLFMAAVALFPAKERG